MFTFFFVTLYKITNMEDKYEEFENFKMVQYRMIAEGFHYCFRHYSYFSEIKDEEFHKLRLEYIESSKKLKDYINNNILIL